MKTPNWLKEISKNPLVQKLCLIALTVFCVYLIIPKWHYFQDEQGYFRYNSITNKIYHFDRSEYPHRWVEIMRDTEEPRSH